MKKKDENITSKGNTRVTYKCIYQHMITYKYPITLFFFLRSTNVRAPYDVVASDLHCSVTKVLVRATYASIWKEEESSFQSNVMIFRSERLFWWKLIFDITLFVSKYSYVWGRTKRLWIESLFVDNLMLLVSICIILVCTRVHWYVTCILTQISGIFWFWRSTHPDLHLLLLSIRIEKASIIHEFSSSYNRNRAECNSA